MDDRQLIQGVISRDPGASDLFIEKYYRLVWSILVRDFSLIREDAEDLHQTIFEKLFEDDFRRLRNWSGQGNFASYLSIVTKHLTIDLLRKKKVRAELPLESDGDDEDDAPAVPEPVSTNPSPEDSAAAAEQRRLLYQALDELSEKDREIITLRHLEEHSYKVLADKMGYQISSVGVILARAERRLREALGRIL